MVADAEAAWSWNNTKEHKAYEMHRRGCSFAHMRKVLGVSSSMIVTYLDHNKGKRTRLGTTIDGKHKVFTNLKKRDYPYKCELCTEFKKGRLYYHHWIDSMPHIGIWLCYFHHRVAEALDQNPGLASTYLKAKINITKECIEVDEEYEARRAWDI